MIWRTGIVIFLGLCALSGVALFVLGVGGVLHEVRERPKRLPPETVRQIRSRERIH